MQANNNHVSPTDHHDIGHMTELWDGLRHTGPGSGPGPAGSRSSLFPLRVPGAGSRGGS
jgi:hypothetical protein